MPDDDRTGRRSIAQTVAAWIVARPQNSVLALLLTLALPLLQILSGAILVLLLLERGARQAAVYALAAGLILIAVAAVAAAPLAQVGGNLAMILLPTLLLGLLLQQTRSLTLTLQVSVILAAAVIIGFGVVVPDAVAYWEPVMQALVEWARENDLHVQADALVAEPAMAADMMTLAFVLTRWMLYVVILLIGYGLARELDGAVGDFGRFRDLDFGRVIAFTMAIASVVAYVLGTDWIQHVAIVLFAGFWLQGLAIVHWLHGNGQLPAFVVIATYALMLVLHVFLLLALAILGYTDAWFHYRRRAAGHRND